MIIHQPEKVVERTYTEGYRERIVERPTGDTEPLPAFVPPPMEQLQPPTIIVHVASPTSISGATHATRPPNGDPQKKRTPDKYTGTETPAPTPATPDPLRQSAHVPESPIVPIEQKEFGEPNKKSSDERTAEEEKSSQPEQKSSVPHKAEPKTSTPVPEVGSSGKVKEYNGMGRRHTDDQIDEILDEYLTCGDLPTYVSERQRRDYRKHKRLPLRRMYLEQAGISTLLGAKENSGDVLSLAERRAQRKTGTS